MREVDHVLIERVTWPDEPGSDRGMDELGALVDSDRVLICKRAVIPS